MSPEPSSIKGSIILRLACKFIKVLSSSIDMDLLNPTTSSAKIVANLRFIVPYSFHKKIVTCLIWVKGILAQENNQRAPMEITIGGVAKHYLGQPFI